MNHWSRREVLGAAGILGGALALGSATSSPAQNHPPTTGHHPGALSSLVPGAINAKGEYVLPPLPYAYDAVSEVIDAETMELHHQKHHNGYVKGLIKAEAALEQARKENDFSLIQYWSQQSAFHGSGHFLHCLFWDSIGPDSMGGQPTGPLAEAINRDFGSYEMMMAQFLAASKKVEGSGWGILAFSLAAEKLVILQAQNHQLLTQWGAIPLLVLDVWEHSYYVKYRNNRGTYVDAFPKIINWDRIAKRYEMLA